MARTNLYADLTVDQLFARLDGIVATAADLLDDERAEWRVKYAMVQREIRRREAMGVALGRAKCARCRHWEPRVQGGLCLDCRDAEYDAYLQDRAAERRNESGYGHMRPADYMSDPRDWGMFGD